MELMNEPISLTIVLTVEDSQALQENVNYQKISDNVNIKVVYKNDKNSCLSNGKQQVQVNHVYNQIINETETQYIMFVRESSIIKYPAIVKAISSAEQNIDIISSHYYVSKEDGSIIENQGVKTEYISQNLITFSYLDCPKFIFQVLADHIDSCIFNVSFLRNNGIRFNETNNSDFSFGKNAAIKAHKIQPLSDIFVTVSEYDDVQNTDPTIITGEMMAISESLKQLPYKDLIILSFCKLAVQQYLPVWDKIRDSKCFRESEIDFYMAMHNLFIQEDFNLLTINDFKDEIEYADYLGIRKHDFDHYKALLSREVIVSFTSYPKRIGTSPEIVKNVLSQTEKPDKIVLYLCDAEFENKTNDLPQELIEMIKQNYVEIHWIQKNLKPHKKYYYAFREFPNSLIITLDDDLKYDPNLIKILKLSYIAFPEAVSAMRTHYIMFDHDGKIAPYREWIKEVRSCLFTPSMRLFCTGGAGAIYAPELFSAFSLSEEEICDLCLNADDIALKISELINGIPVVLCAKNSFLHYIDNTQDETALWATNINENDIQFKSLTRHAENHFGENIIKEKLLSFQEKELRINQIMDDIYRSENKKRTEIQGQLKRAYREKTDLNKKLQETYEEKYQRGVTIQELNHKIDSLKENNIIIKQENKELKREVTELQKTLKNRIIRKVKNVLNREK